MSLFLGLPWLRVTELAARALIAWEPPRSGLSKLQEECGEVVTAVNQFNYGRIDALELAREMVDALLMIVQGAHVVGEAVFSQAFQEKFARLGARLREHSSGCPVCEGAGDSADGMRCAQCLKTPTHDPGCGLAEEHVCTCGLGHRRQLMHMNMRVGDMARALEPPSDEWLEEVFRDFAPGLDVKTWRRRVYERMVARHVMRMDVLHG